MSRQGSSLDDELLYFNALAVIVRNAKEDVRNRPHEKKNLELGFFDSKKKQKKRDLHAQIDEHFDRLHSMIVDAFLLRLVAAFEVQAFEQLKNAIGEAKKAAKENMSPGAPFASAAEKLVRSQENFRNLSDIEDLFTSYAWAPVEDFQQLREHRNHVAHGGRVGQLSRFTEIEDVHRSLSELLRAIRG